MQPNLAETMNSALPIMVLSLGLRMADLQSQAQSALTLLERLLSVMQTWAGTQRGLELPIAAAIGAAAAVVLLLIGAILLLMRARREIQKVRQELAAIIACRKATESAGEATTEFLASMNHWIRTPVNAMVSFIDLALQTGLDPELAQHEDTVRASANRLLHIADDVLELSRIEAGRLQLDNIPFSISECILSAMKLVEGEAAAKSLLTSSKIDPRLPDTVSGDPERLRHVIFNLLDYAVRVTACGSVLVSAALESSSGDEVLVRVTVTGTGLGIPVAGRPLISEPHQHAGPGAALKPSERGVGLLISGRLIDLMRGTMKPQSQSDGSTLEFTVQFQKQTTATRAEAPALVSAPKRDSVAQRELSILIAEGNAADRRLIAKVLESAGHRVWVATNGKQAVQNVQTEGFDLILLDLEMPGLDGLEIARAIRAAEPPGLHVPIYAFTARALPEEREKCLAAGMDGFVAKPLSADEISQLASKLAASTANTNRAVIAAETISVASHENTDELAPTNSASVPDLEPVAFEAADNSYKYVDDTPVYQSPEQNVSATSDSVECTRDSSESKVDTSESNTDSPESKSDSAESNMDWGTADFALASMLSEIEDVAPNSAGTSYLPESNSTPSTDQPHDGQSRNTELSLYLLANATAEKTNGSSNPTTPLSEDETPEMPGISKSEDTRDLTIRSVEPPVIGDSPAIGNSGHRAFQENQSAEIVSVLAETEPSDRNTDCNSVAVNTRLSASVGLALLEASTQLTQTPPPALEQKEARQPSAASPTPAGNRQAARSPLPGLEGPTPTGSWDPFEEARKSLSSSRFGVRVIHNDGDPSDRNLI